MDGSVTGKGRACQQCAQTRAWHWCGATHDESDLQEGGPALAEVCRRNERTTDGQSERAYGRSRCCTGQCAPHGPSQGDWRKKAQKARMLALLALLILTSGVAAFTPPTPAPVLRCCACAAVHQRRPCRIESPFSHVPRTRQDRGQDRVLGTCRDAQPTVVSRSPACLRGLTCEPPARGRASTHRRRRAPCSEGRKGGHDLRTEPEAVDDRGRAHSARIRRYSHGRHMRSVCLTISV